MHFRPRRAAAAICRYPTSGVFIIAALLFLGVVVKTERAYAAPAPAVMQYSVTATPVSEFPVVLTAGVPVTFRTTEVEGAEDPVLHLFNPNGVQVAVADNGGGGRAAFLSYTPTSTATYRVMVRSRSTTSFGLADLLMNNQPWRTEVAFAGVHLPLSGLRSGEQLRTTVVPGGVDGPLSLYVLAADGVSIVGRAVGSGPDSGAFWSAPVAYASATVVVGSPPGRPGGVVRLARNDVALSGHDPDGDGLGDELEAKIGTCSARSGIRLGFDCAGAADARDTDGDGIRDGWEFFGRLVFRVTGAFAFELDDVALPKWGANPRHKDLFVEVDFMLRCPGEAPKKMSPAVARSFASYYQDQVGSPTSAQRAAHAASLRNPDGLTGIAVHLDTGEAPQTAADATTYGDWGGYTAVPRAQPGSLACKGADYAQAWKAHMAAGRRGIFRYALPYSSGAGQTGINYFAFTGGLDNAPALVHESGHAMGLGHSGPAFVTAKVDVNCKPNYSSVMNYAFLYRGKGFADGTGTPPLNNAALAEWHAASPTNAAFLDTLEQDFRYWVDRENGHVDWNRDGEIARVGTTVRAYANYRPNGACEYTRYNEGTVSNQSSEASRLSPAIARLDQRAYAFYVTTGGALHYAHSDSEWLCPVPSSTPCATWTSPQTSGLSAVGGVDVVRLDSPKSLLVVTVDGSGRLWHSRLSTNVFGAETWTTPTLIPGSSPVVGEPSLARRALCSTYLTYKTTGGELRHRQYSCANGWEPEQRSLTTTGDPIVLPAYASPGTAHGYLPSRPGASSLLGAFAHSSGGLILWRLDEASGRWVRSADLTESTGAAEGRPALAWVPTNPPSDTTGRLYLMWIAHNVTSPAKRTVRMGMSYTKVTRLSSGELLKVPQVGLTADFDNVWHFAYGIDLLYDRGYDSNLISIESRASDNPPGPTGVSVRPKADGINDFRYVNYDDWATLRLGLCRNVVDPGKLGPNAVTCP